MKTIAAPRAVRGMENEMANHPNRSKQQVFATIPLDRTLNRYGEVSLEPKPDGLAVDIVTEGGKLAFRITAQDARLIAKQLLAWAGEAE
jgi:hypothetical protein